MKIGVIGTGLLGGGVARRLMAVGHDVVVWNRTSAKAKAFVAEGARMAASPADVIGGCEWTMLVLKDAPATELVLFDGQAREVLKSARLIQMATVSPEQSRSLASKAEAAGADMLECPVLGSTEQAVSGELIVMFAGSPQLARAAEPLLAELGEQRFDLGEIGKPASLKLALNQLLVAEVAALSLSLGLVAGAGVPTDLFMAIVANSALNAPQLHKKLPGMLARDFSNPHFPVTHMLKDVELMLREASRLGLRADAVAGIRDVLTEAIARGDGELDYAALHNTIVPPSG